MSAGATCEHARRRERSILAFIATSITSRGLGIGCQLVQIPIALHYLGNEAFGLWVTLASFCYFLTCADLGIGMGVQNKVAEAWGRNDQADARRFFVTGFVALAALTVLLLAILVPVAWGNGLAGLFHIADPTLRAALGPAILAVVTLWCLNVPLGLAQRLAYAAQLGWAHNAANTVAQVTMLAAVCVGSWLRLGLTPFFVLTFATSVVVNVIFFGYLLHRLGWRQFSRAEFQPRLLRQLTHLGFFFFLQQIANLIVFSAPPLIVSATIGVAAVTPFNLVQRVLNLFTVVTNAILLPIWPAYTEAKARGDWPWIRRTLIRSVAIVFGVAVIPMIVLGAWITPLIGWWTQGAAIPPAQSLVILLIAWNILLVVQQPFGYLLAGLSHVRGPTLYSFLSLAVILPAIYYFLPTRGVEAIPLGLILGFVPFILVGNVVESLLCLRRVAGTKVADPPATLEPASVSTHSDDPPAAELVAASTPISR